jgi:hypothetical protein
MWRCIAIAFVLLSCAKDDRTAQRKLDLAKLTVEKYAFEAYPRWAMSHPDKSCPSSLGDMAEYMNAKSPNDPWGKPYVMLCGADLPRGVKGVAVLSFGPDQLRDTADDIKSW